VSEQPPGTSGEFSPGEFQAGWQIAGYRLEEQIGQGGMAVVFRAYDSRLDRQVALKILAPRLALDTAFRHRFIRESRAAAAVDDPHIIPVFEAGEANGVLFIAMRYVRGGDVRSLIDQIGPLPARRTADIVSQAASALDAAHARGLVHRDVKPANMLLEASAPVDRPEHLYLSDFGLSKTSLAASGLTATGQFLGTLDYVAPEQIEGRPLDGRSDEYALACSAFEMLCGEPPFRREQSVSVMYAHLSEPPPPVRLRRPDLPVEVDQVLAKALAKAPAARYATCRDFAAALRLALGLDVSRQDSPAAGHPITEIAFPVAAAVPPVDDPRIARSPAVESPAVEPPVDEAPISEPPTAGLPVAALTQPAAVPSTTRAGLTDPSGGGASQPSETNAWPQAGRPHRPWWRSPAPVAGLCAVALFAAGGAFALADRGHAAGSGGSSPRITPTLPGCTTATATAATLSGVTSAVTQVSGSPFGVAVTPDNQYSFISGNNAVAVLRNPPALVPTLIDTIAAPGADKSDTITPDGRFLVAAAGSGAVVIDVAAAEQDAADPIVGSLTSPKGSGAVQVLISANEKFVFVTLQSSAEMAVFNLQKALSQGFAAADFIGYVPLPTQPVGMTTDGTWLYVTSFAGTLSVVSLSRAETDPAHAVVATARAGCQPARALISANHRVIWVTARGSDELLAFSVAKLRTDPKHALIAKVMVGETPIGETFVDGGARIVVADSNVNGLAGVPSNLAVVSTARALSGKPALLGYLPTGSLPRQFAVEPGGTTLLVTVQNADQLEAIKIADLP
jgi:serine/threonine protein kinase